LTFLLKPDSFNSYNCEFCGSTAPRWNNASNRPGRRKRI